MRYTNAASMHMEAIETVEWTRNGLSIFAGMESVDGAERRVKIQSQLKPCVIPSTQLVHRPSLDASPKNKPRLSILINQHLSPW